MANPIKWLGSQIVGAINRKIERDLDQFGRAVVARAQSLAPVKTGRLRSGIHHTVTNRILTIHSDIYYSVFQEFGTRRIPPHPFIRPALNETPLPWGGRLAISFPNTPTYARPIYYHRGNYVLPGTLSRGQRRHVAEHLLPEARRHHRANARRARMIVGGGG